MMNTLPKRVTNELERYHYLIWWPNSISHLLCSVIAINSQSAHSPSLTRMNEEYTISSESIPGSNGRVGGGTLGAREEGQALLETQAC